MKPGPFIRWLGRFIGWIFFFRWRGWTFVRCRCGGHWEKLIPWGGPGSMAVARTPSCSLDSDVYLQFVAQSSEPVAPRVKRPGYLTKEGMDEERKRLLDYDFGDGEDGAEK